jgi:hypothetical protein
MPAELIIGIAINAAPEGLALSDALSLALPLALSLALSE